MGILELHFHDSQFDVSPSMSTGGSDSEEESGGIGWRSKRSSGEESEEESGSSGPGVGAVLALVVLVGVAALVGIRRRGGSEESEDVTLEA